MKRINFNVENDMWRELKMLALKNGFDSLTEMFKSWASSALLRQREKENKPV